MRKTLTALPLIALVLAGCAATPAETETAEVVVTEPVASPIATLDREPAVPRQAGNDYYLNAQAAIDAYYVLSDRHGWEVIEERPAAPLQPIIGVSDTNTSGWRTCHGG